MDDQTREKVSDVMCGFLNDLIRIADEGNYDRDSFVVTIAHMFKKMADISTFGNFKIDGGDHQ